MLQRAASNAYSWWWASHIRTKQSKWLEQNLQDMEEKVEAMLKLIQEDGDSFAKRAEMYYKRRPELINFVEESFKAYRSIAERYDKMSTELQNANNTLATVFPERVQFAMDEDEDDRSASTDKFPRTPKKSSNIPKVPNLPKDKDLKGLFTSATKKIQAKKGLKSGFPDGGRVVKSGLTQPQAIEEIDKLQKGVLALQTEKEYVKSSYDLALAKYWELEKIIREKHDRIYNLQDEFNISQIIEDDEARNIMVTTALRSCDETLASLQDIQKNASEEAKIEQGRIKDAQQKLNSLKNDGSETVENMKEEEEQGIGTEEKQQLESLRGKIKMYFEEGSKATLTVTEMAENIDELVNKVIILETTVLSQTVLLKRLRTETDELQSQISTLEGDKTTLISASGDMSCKLREMGGKFNENQGSNQNIDDQNNNLEIQFTQAHCCLAQLAEKLHTMKPDEELGASVLSDKENGSLDGNGSSDPIVNLEKADGSLDELDSLTESKCESNSLDPVVHLETVDGSSDELKAPKESKEDKNLTEPVVSVEKVEESKDQNTSAGPVDHLETVDGSLGELKSRKESNDDDNNLPDPVVNMEIVDGALVESQKESKDERTSPSPAVNFEKVDDIVDSRRNEEEKGVQTLENDSPYRLFLTPKNHKMHDKTEKQDSSQKHNGEDEPNWRQLFMNGLENREKILLTEYTTILRSLKDVKKQLGEAEKKSQDSLKQMRHANGAKDEEIRSLRQKLSFLVTTLDDNPGLKELKDSYPQVSVARVISDEKKSNVNGLKNGEEDEEQIKVTQVDQPSPSSAIEQKLRTKIDEVLEENLDFWLNFSSTFHQIQKFQTGVEDLQAEISKLEGKLRKKQDGSIVKDTSLKSDAKPIYKHLQEIETELALWLEQSTLLKDESHTRFKALCAIEEEISQALTTGCEQQHDQEEAGVFTSYQAGKFQGEVLNMKQENSKVAEELHSGLDLAATLQLDIQKTLAKLDEDFEISGTSKNTNQEATLKHSTSRSRIPLRSFIFGVKPKKQRLSIFSSIHPVLHRKLNDHSHRSGHGS